MFFLFNIKKVKLEVKCLYCGTAVFKWPCSIKERNFCSKECADKHRSKKYNPGGYQRNFNAGHLTELNKKLNPTRMTPEIRLKIRNSHLGKGDGKSYTKIFRRHTHRVVAEGKIGRKLIPGEVVHHKDENIHNNDPDNLEVFPSQKEHARWHKHHAI